MPYCPECSAAVQGDAKACPTCGASLVTTPTAAPEGPAAPPVDVEALRADLAASLAPTYELLKALGEGGMGMVFLAREPALKRLVAVKLLAPHLAGDPRSRARFEREARAAAALSHPNVVRVSDGPSGSWSTLSSAAIKDEIAGAKPVRPARRTQVPVRSHDVAGMKGRPMNRKSLPWIVTAVAVGLLGGVLVAQKMGSASHHPDPRPGITGVSVIPASDWNFEPIVRAYTAAAQNAEVLDGIYCYCQCKEHLGHRSLLTCFESEHGSGCDICQGEAVLAAQMHGQGATLDQIRQVIDRQYGG